MSNVRWLDGGCLKQCVRRYAAGAPCDGSLLPAADDEGRCRPCGTRNRLCCAEDSGEAPCGSSVQQCVSGTCLRCGRISPDPGCPGTGATLPPLSSTYAACMLTESCILDARSVWPLSAWRLALHAGPCVPFLDICCTKALERSALHGEHAMLVCYLCRGCSAAGGVER